MVGRPGSRQREFIAAWLRHRGTPPPAGDEFPPDTRIQEVAVTRTRVAGTWQWHAVFLMRVPRVQAGAETQPAKPACGIDIGWRQTDHGVRVAIVASEIDGVDEIILPQPIIDGLLAHHEAQSRAHHDREELLLRLRAVNWDRAPESLRRRADAVCSKRDADGEFCATGLDVRGLVAEWTASAPRFLPGLLDEATSWAIDDRNAWLAIRGRRRLAARRLDFYRCVARRLIDRHGLVGIEKLDLAQMASRAKGKLPPLANRMRVICATHELLGAIVHAAARDGSRVHRHLGKSSFLCHKCGHVTAVADRSVLHYTCGGCNRTHDQDVNAARVLLAAARASGSEATKPPEALAWQKRLAAKQKRRAAAAQAAAAE